MRRVACFDDRHYVHLCAGECDGLEESRREQALGLAAQERCPRRGAAFGRWVDVGVAQDLPDGGGGEGDAEGEQLTVNAPVTPRRVLPRQP